MAASVRVITAQDDGGDLANGHSTKLIARERADYEAGLESWVRTIRGAPPELKETVVRNAVSECVGYIRGGLSKQIIVDRLNGETAPVGLNIEDLIDRQINAPMAILASTASSVTTNEHPPSTLRPSDQARLKPILWSDLHNLPKREALIEGLLDCSALSVVFGPSGCCKTFFALDLAAHIAIGQAWRDRDVLQGAAVYVAAEGGYGIIERLTAFSCQYEIHPQNVPLYVIPEPIDLCHSETDVDLLMNHLGNLLSDQPVRLLIVDTVSRALAGGNENSPDHMGAFIKRCDKLRKSTGAHVMLLHHTGKDTSQGARGHSSLRAAVDTEIEMTWDKEERSGRATVTKQRDSRTEGTFPFTLDEVDVDVRTDGGLVTSCVVMPVHNSLVSTTAKPARLAKGAQTALLALQKAVDEFGVIPAPSDHIPAGMRAVTTEQWRQRAYSMGISKGENRAKQKAFKTAYEQLLAGDHVGVWNDQVWLTGRP